MEIREISDKNIWEKFIKENSPQSFFQSWSWGEVIESQKSKVKSQNFKRFGLFENKTLLGIAQVEKVDAKRGTFLHVRHGPIFTEWRKEYLDFLVKEFLIKTAKELKCVFIRISPLIENNEENKRLLSNLNFRDAPIHTMDGEYCWVLNLNKSEEELLSGMRKTTRNLIRQAQKYGVEIVKTTKRDCLDGFIKLYDHTAKRHKFVKHKGIIEEFDILKKDNNILLLNGFYRKEMLSSALIIFYNNQVIYHHSASISSKIPVNYLLQWEAIKEAKRRGKEIYNFWGIAPLWKNNHPWKGLSLFKMGFGGKVVEYLHAQDIPCSIKYCATYLIETLRKIKKGY